MNPYTVSQLNETVFKHFDMETNDKFQKQPYEPGKGKRGIVRSGQEKLFAADLMSYIYFYIKRGVCPRYVVVAGGAPGDHFVELIKRLPQATEWHLYDPVPFNGELQELREKNFKVFTHQQLYETKDCLEWSKLANVLFLSDIRNTDYSKIVSMVEDLKSKRSRCREKAQEKKITLDIQHLQLELENMAKADMTLQEQMVRNTKAEMSVVKMRLPYWDPRQGENSRMHTYLHGRVWFQYQNRPNSTECRLVVEPKNVSSYKELHEPAVFEMQNYDVKSHEEKCAFINNQLRPMWDVDAWPIIDQAYQTMMRELETPP